MKPKFEKQSEVRSGPAAFGRLCVETIAFAVIRIGKRASRLRAAVC